MALRARNVARRRRPRAAGAVHERRPVLAAISLARVRAGRSGMSSAPGMMPLTVSCGVRTSTTRTLPPSTSSTASRVSVLAPVGGLRGSSSSSSLLAARDLRQRPAQDASSARPLSACAFSTRRRASSCASSIRFSSPTPARARPAPRQGQDRDDEGGDLHAARRARRLSCPPARSTTLPLLDCRRTVLPPPLIRPCTSLPFLPSAPGATTSA